MAGFFLERSLGRAPMVAATKHCLYLTLGTLSKAWMLEELNGFPEQPSKLKFSREERSGLCSSRLLAFSVLRLNKPSVRRLGSWRMCHKPSKQR